MARIYISSTYSDLTKAREAVYRALRQMRHDIIAMEDYVAMDQRPLDKCLADVAKCDIYIGIFAWRYGYIPPNQERSITELEFREAVRTGKPCLLFLLHEAAPWPKNLRDPDSKRIEALRTELSRDYLVSFFRTSEELAAAVSIAVANLVTGALGKGAPGPTEVERVAAALALLEQMPTAEVPERGTLAAGSRLPLRANPVFVGREEELKALARALQEGQTAAIGQVATVTGLGGIGKTQLAVEFAHRYGPYFAGGVFWLSLAEPEGVATEIARCGGAEGLGLYGEESGLSLEEQVKRVRAAWQSALPRLLVFDNCEEEELLAQWRPTTGGCRVLVTSRRRLWEPALGVELLRLEVLARRESIELLQKLIEAGAKARGRQAGVDEAELGAIAAELGDLPLALHLAGSYLGTLAGEVTAAEYLAELHSEAILGHESLQGVDLRVSPTHHQLHVGRTFALSYEQLRPAEVTEALALALLARATYFSPGEPIPRELLLLTVELPDEAARRRANRALQRLGELGLLEEEEGRLVLHRLVARFVREVNQESEAQAAVEAALLVEAQRLNQAGYPEPLLRWQAHLRWLTEAALERGDERAAELGNELGSHLNMIGDYAGARPYYEWALAIREKVLGPEHPDTATSLNNLGLLLQDMGDYAGARPYLERTLAIREKVLGPEHPSTATSLNNLGALLKDIGDYAGARPYLERALAIVEKVLGPEHPSTATSLNNLGYVLQAMGDSARARPYFERALAIREKVLGPEHPSTATSLNNLGALLKDIGDYAGARPYLERALAIVEKVLGPEHPDTATSLNNLGLLLQDMGDYAGARPYFERALAIREKMLGPEHPSTATSLNNLGALLKDIGDYTEARPYYERALAIVEKVLGPEHPSTATSLNNLGYVLQAMGDSARARPYFERALAIREKVLGPEHPSTATSLNNLGALLKDIGDYAGARPYLERALAIVEKVLGPEHPDTATSLNNLGALLDEMGDYTEARPYYERALAIQERVLGPEHPDTAQSLNHLGSLLYAMGDYAGARPYYERALAIWERVLGPEHPETASSLNSLGFLLQVQGNYARARAYFERALAIREKILGSEHPDTTQSLINLGSLLKDQGDYTAAQPNLEQALELARRNEKPLMIAEILISLGDLARSRWQINLAKEYWLESRDIYRRLRNPIERNVVLLLNELESTQAAVSSLVEPVHRFLKSAGFELILRDAESGKRMVAIPQNETWKKRFEYGVYIEITAKQSSDSDFVYNIRTHAQQWKASVKHALLITDRELESQEWLMIHALAAQGFTIIPIPARLFSILSPEMDATTLLLEHIDKRLGADYDPYKETGAVYGAGNFFGRVGLLNKLETALLKGTPQALFGIRKLGKSSILYHLATKIHLPVAVLDLQGENFEPSHLYWRMLSEWSISAESKFNVLWSLPPLFKPVATRDNFLEATYDLFHTLQAVVKQPRVAVFIDEGELLVPRRDEAGEKLDDYLEFIETLRTLSSGRSNMLSILFTSFDPSLMRISHWGRRQNPAYQLFEVNYLNPLPVPDCEQMIQSLGHQIRLEYTQDAINLIYEASGGHPFIARQLCSLAIKRMKEEGKQEGQVSPELFREVIDGFNYNPDTASHLNRDGLWGVLTQPAIWGEQEAQLQGELLCFLAAEGGPHPIAKFIQSKNVAARRATVEELKNFWIIKEVTPGHYDITFGCFKSWIQAWQL